MLLALIPAYNPIETLPNYVEQLLTKKVFTKIIIINDGSKESCDPIFTKVAALPDVVVLKHAINRGKGAALRTGLNYIACEFKNALGVVTIDADGQHDIEDACKVAQALKQAPNHLIIGSRNFKKEIPFRSLFGNMFTRHTLRIIAGIKLSDTQSGLRGIPMSLVPDLLSIDTNGYEFELDMLIAAKHEDYRLEEIPIKTIYLDDNMRSSFRPLWDSLRIYFVLLRFSIIAILSALLDYAVFMTVYFFIAQKVMLALICSRFISVTFNYLSVRRFAFHSREPLLKTLPKYLVLAVISGLIAYTLITGFMSLLSWHVVFAKIGAEFITFIINFLIQRDFIFKKHKI